jgi:GNAT superfamily N-acetyltransferase
MEVDPEYRRQGLAVSLIGTIAQWAWARGARSIYAQAGETNEVAERLYRATGFEPHHRYAYLTPQTPRDHARDSNSSYERGGS